MGVVVELSGDETKLLKAFNKILESQNKMDQGLKKLKDSSQRAGKEVQETFGQQAVRGITNYVTQMASLTSGVQLFRNAMQQARQESLGVIAAVNGLTEARRRLNQVGESAGDIEAQNQRADALAVQYGVPRNVSRSLMFSARSEGFEGSEADIMRLYRANVLDVESAVQSAGMVRGNFDQTITPQQSLVATLIGARTSRMNAEQFASELPKLTGAVGFLGASPAETMATASVLATRNSRANEYTATFANALGIMPQFAGKGLLGATDELTAMPEAERRKLLGTSKEMNMAYGWLVKDAAKIRRTQSELEAGMAAPDEFITQQERQSFFADTYEANLRRAQVQYNKAQIEREIAAEQASATGGFAREAAVERYMAGRADRGRDPMSRFVGKSAAEYAADFGVSPGMIDRVGRGAEDIQAMTTVPGLLGMLKGVIDDWRGVVNDQRRAASDQVNASESIDRAAGSLEANAQQRAAAGVAE